MGAVSRVQRGIVAGAMILTSAIGGVSGVAAQGSPQPDFEPDYFESMLTGFEIEITDDTHTIDDVYQQNYIDGENELIYVSSDTSLIEISLFDDEDAPADTIDMWIELLAAEMDDLEVIDSGEDGDVSWSYAIGTLDGDEYAYYLQTEAGVFDDIYLLESVLTPAENLVDAVEDAQGAITIDGDPFMDDVDLDELQELVDGGSYRDGGTPESDDADDADEDSTDDRSRDRDQDPDDEDTGRDRSRDRDRDTDDTGASDERPARPGDDDSSGDDDEDESGG